MTREQCYCLVCSEVQKNIDNIKCVLKIYNWLLDAYVVDFFQDNVWQKMLKSWTEFLNEITLEELGKWILNEPGNSRVWPLSLITLRTFIENAEISRDHKKQYNLKCLSNNCTNTKKLSREKQKTIIKNEFDNLFTKHVKKKKRYEIDVLSQIAADCANNLDCKCIVDIGSGMGHLARVLAFKHDLFVTCVEQNESLLETARKWDDQLAGSLLKHIPDFCKKKPQHKSLKIEVTKTARQKLANQLTDIFNENFNSNDGFGLVGLHPCGDLAPSLLRFYTSEEKARFICIVGCCYMKLSLDPNNSDDLGYPMSQYLLKSTNHKLSYAALEVACHAIEKHCDKLKTDNYDLKVHAYRAVLEYLLVEKNPDLRHAQLKNTKIKSDTSFYEYCRSVTEKLEIKYRPTDADMERNDVKNFLKQWKRVVVFNTLRLLISRLVETLVLLDRFLYLSEMNLSPSLNAEFDSRVSPRNIVLVSMKNKNC